MTDTNNYRAYMNSLEWREKRNSVMQRAYYRCEVGPCGKPAIEVHHLTYARLYAEELSDLVAICKDCHDALTDASCSVKLRCLESGEPDCVCPVCQYHKSEAWLRHGLRYRLSTNVNAYLYATNVRLYGPQEVATIKFSGLRSKNLPPMLVCGKTGKSANTDEACGTCDACLWVRAMETAFREEEGRDA